MTQEAIEDIPTHGYDDLLARTLNMPEYSGRVRALGEGVTPARYYDKKPKVRPPSRVAKLEANMLLMQQQIDLLLAHRCHPSGQQSHVPPTSESPSIEDYSCTMPRVPIPQVIDALLIYKLLIWLNCRFIAEIEHSFVGRVWMSAVF